MQPMRARQEAETIEKRRIYSYDKPMRARQEAETVTETTYIQI